MANLDKSPKTNKRQQAIMLKNKLMSKKDVKNTPKGKPEYGGWMFW
jgi:hypothetical protein